MFGGFGAQEIFLILLVVLLLFGAKRLPEIGASLGKGIREFKSSVREIESELKAPENDRGQIPPRNQSSQSSQGVQSPQNVQSPRSSPPPTDSHGERSEATEGSSSAERTG